MKMRISHSIPPPYADEPPTDYADRVGRWYAASVSANHKKRFGQYLTPAPVARFMAGLCEPPGLATLRVLDPGAGAGILACALCETLATRSPGVQEIELAAHETDPGLAECLVASLTYAGQWSQAQGVKLDSAVYTDDFVLTYAEALDETPSLFSTYSTADVFDIVIANPPYFKLPKSDPRALAAATVVHGQPNIYALFMAIAARLLKPGGSLVFITPRSYAAGPYFRRFREYFFSLMLPEVIHLFGSRRDAFSRDEVLQENVVLMARRSDNWRANAGKKVVRISFSAGTQDLPQVVQRAVPLAEVLNPTDRARVMHIPTTLDADEAVRIVRSWSGNLHAYGFEISTGPVVPFRAADLIDKSGDVPGTHVPLLWMQNVHPMQVKWPANARGKRQYIAITAAKRSLLVSNDHYVLLRRFSAKEQHRRVTAAPLLSEMFCSPLIGLENHLNYIHRPDGHLSIEEVYGLAALLNSELLDTYVRVFNGNTQVSATELRTMPLPPLEKIAEIGRRIMSESNLTQEIDALVEDVLDIKVPTSSLQRSLHE
ncbi:MAG: methyltransferase [Chloroflexi bacterium HGW-Chloroflexi-1]|nr:MAG: methyltransferase [Chloroflexi bacterium HGW-Chloroflexi-1]